MKLFRGQRYVCVLMAMICAGFTVTITSAWGADLPKLVTVVTNKVGNMQYTHAVAFSDAVGKKVGLKIKVEPRASDAAKVSALNAGAAEMMTSVSTNSHNIAVGEGEFSRAEWGPQALRVVHTETIASPIALGVKKDSGLKVGQDLKGKRVAYYPTAAGRTRIVEAILMFYGLTWNDVVKVPAAGFTQAQEALLDGRVDASYANPSNALAFRLAAAPHGIHWLQMPLSNKEGWKTFLSMTNGALPNTCLFGSAGISPDNPLECVGTVGVTLSKDTLSDAVAYAMAKGIAEGYAYYKDVDKHLNRETLRGGIDNWRYIIHPYHPGAIKYLKEKGVWTADDEAYQKSLLQEEAKLKASWKPH